MSKIVELPDEVIVFHNKEGNCLSVFTSNEPYYGEWIKGEGADICLYRSIKDNKLIGINLPFYPTNKIKT